MRRDVGRVRLIMIAHVSRTVPADVCACSRSSCRNNFLFRREDSCGLSSRNGPRGPEGRLCEVDTSSARTGQDIEHIDAQRELPYIVELTTTQSWAKVRRWASDPVAADVRDRAVSASNANVAATGVSCFDPDSRL